MSPDEPAEGAPVGPSEERLFTVDEADALLPEIRAMLGAMRKARSVVIASGERVKEAVVGNGGGSEAQGYSDAVGTLRSGVEAMSEKGIIVRDVESGLVDFPAERDGRIVYLCWRLGEDRVAYWHPPETGFPGRKPL